MTFLLDFVDAISATPTVRLSLVGDRPWRALGDTAFPPPRLQRAEVSTLLADGGIVPAAAYDNRSIELVARVQDPDPEIAAQAIQALARELNRNRNLLRYQPDTQSPVFFRTFRSDFTSIRFDPVDRRVSVEVLAEPFAYGLKEVLPAATVFNDPAEGTVLNANPYFETNATNWTINGGSGARSTAQFHEGAASLLLTPNGVAATPEAGSERVPVVAGQSVRAGAWLRCAAARQVDVWVQFYDAGGSFITSSGTSGGTLTINTWTRVDHFVASAPVGATAMNMYVFMPGTPPGSALLYIDEARIRVVQGCFWDVVGVKGDVETPLVFKRPTPDVGAESLFAVRRRGIPSALPWVIQAESLTQGTNTTTQAFDTAMSGVGNNYSRCTFGTATWTTRLSSTAYPSTASVDARGVYRVFARCRKSANSGVVQVRLQVAGVTGTAATVTGSSVLQMVDLGLMSIPSGPDPIADGPTGVEIPVRGPALALQAQRTSGTDNLDVDYLVLVPADDRLAIAHWPTSISPADRVVLDGVNDMVYPIVDSTGELISATPGYHVGGAPMLSPNSTNRIYYLNEVAPGTAEPSWSTSWQFAGWYWPRYLNVRPVAS